MPLKLVVEIDGHTHSLERDSQRDNRLAQLGFDVLHFSVQEIDENLNGVINTIHREVELRLLRLQTLKDTPT